MNLEVPLFECNTPVDKKIIISFQKDVHEKYLEFKKTYNAHTFLFFYQYHPKRYTGGDSVMPYAFRTYQSLQLIKLF